MNEIDRIVCCHPTNWTQAEKYVETSDRSLSYEIREDSACPIGKLYVLNPSAILEATIGPFPKSQEEA